MGDSTSPVIDWNDNNELDLAGYRVYFGLQAGVYTGIQTVLAPTSTYTFAMNQFNADGLWNFAVSAYDTSGNESALSAVVSRRVVRTGSTLIRRR